MNIVKKQLGIFSVLLSLLLLVGCGLPDELVEKAKTSIPKEIVAVKTYIEGQKNFFKKLKNSNDWVFLSSYSTKEKLPQHFKKADAVLMNAQNIYDINITGILSRDEEDEASKLKAEMRNLQKFLKEAKVHANVPATRVNFLFKARKQAPDWVKQASLELSATKKTFSEVSQSAIQAKKDYPQKSQDIDGRLAGIKKVIDNSSSAFNQAQLQLKNVASGDADYALLGDSTKLVAAKQKEVDTMTKKLFTKLDELYRSYSKVLTDMKIEYFVLVKRVSWDNCCDRNTEVNHTYRASPVTEKSYNYFANLSEGTAATRSSGWSSWNEKTAIDVGMWNALRIDMGESWPNGHDAAEFWFENVYAKTYHKYLIVENGVKKETDWIELQDEDIYWKQEENLGLEITSKPYGMYEEEVLQSAAPPGLAYIAKPTVSNGQATGKNQYGEWKQDSSGTSFWHYYGQYAFISNLLGPSHSYRYSDWDSYNRRDRSSGYYGANGGYGTYGNRTYNSSRYKNGSYAKRNPSVVKSSRATRPKSSSNRSRSGSKSSSRSQTASVRGSGPRNRGKGPGGAGK